jgi:hypothetical protein
LKTKFRPNRRIFVFWPPFWIQNGHHSKPKWSPYGATWLTPCKYPFPLKYFNILIFSDFFNFYIGGHFENFKKKSTTLSDDLFLCQVSKGSAVRFSLERIYYFLHLGDHGNGWSNLMKSCRNIICHVKLCL